MSAPKPSKGEIIGGIFLILAALFCIFCIVMAVITTIQSIHDSGVCEGRGGTYMDGKCLAHVEVLH